MKVNNYDSDYEMIVINHYNRNEMGKKTVIRVDGLLKYNESVIIHFHDNTSINFHHSVDCCESVRLEDFEDDDIIGGDVLKITEATSPLPDTEWGDTATWTFFRVETTKGEIWMRWMGESNGYYSERVCVKYND